MSELFGSDNGRHAETPGTAARNGDRQARDRWQAASASIAPNEAYVGERLKFRGPAEVEHGMVDTVDGVTARRILRRALYGLLLLLPFYAMHAVSGLTRPDSSYGEPNPGGSGSALLVLGILIYLAVVLLLPMRQTLSEWTLLVDNRADLAESAYATIAEELLRRQVPAHVHPRRKLVRMPQPGIRNFLLVRLGKYVVFVSVFGFGRDLYLGWSLIRRDIPVLFLLRYLVSKLGTDPGYSRLIDIEPVKALREVVHNALRTGIEAAAVGRDITIDSVFNRPVPVEEPTVQAGGVAASLPAR